MMEHVAKCNLDYLEYRRLMRLVEKNKSTMRYAFSLAKYLVLTIFILGIQETGLSQTDSTQQIPVTDSAEIKYDSAKNKIFNYIKQSGDSGRRKNLL
jgi:hypothetical protein